MLSAKIVGLLAVMGCDALLGTAMTLNFGAPNRGKPQTVAVQQTGSEGSQSSASARSQFARTEPSLPSSSQLPPAGQVANSEQDKPAANTREGSAENATVAHSAANKRTSTRRRKNCPTKGAMKTTRKPCVPKRVVVREGGTVDSGGQLSAGVSDGEASHQRESTSRLLHLTDSNLKAISGRTLTPDQQDILRQVNMYVQQSRSAIGDGDFVRARNLALKAHLLSDALVHR